MILHLTTAKTLRGGELQLEHLAEADSKSMVVMDRKLLEKYPLHFRKNSIVSLNMNFFFGLTAIFQLIEITRKTTPKILHAHTSRAHTFALILKLFFPALRVMATKRVLLRKKLTGFSRLKYSPRLNSRLFAVSYAVKNSLPPSIQERMTVAYSAVASQPAADEERMGAREKYIKQFSLPNDVCILTMASHFSSEKRWHDLIKSLAFLKTNKPWIFLAAGTGENLESFQQLVRQQGLEQKVIFLGHVENIRELFLASDIAFLLSSWEALGTTLLEAGLAGCALIGTKVGGIPEIIEPCKTGLLVELGDLFELAFAIDLLINDSELRYSLSKEARSFISHKFSLQRMLDAYKSVYS